MNKSKKENVLDLPRGWRGEVAKLLSAKGLTLSESQIYDIKRGKNNDLNLTNEVFNALRQISREYEKKKTRLARIRNLSKSKA